MSYCYVNSITITPFTFALLRLCLYLAKIARFLFCMHKMYIRSCVFLIMWWISKHCYGSVIRSEQHSDLSHKFRMVQPLVDSLLSHPSMITIVNLESPVNGKTTDELLLMTHCGTVMDVVQTTAAATRQGCHGSTETSHRKWGTIRVFRRSSLLYRDLNFITTYMCISLLCLHEHTWCCVCSYTYV